MIIITLLAVAAGITLIANLLLNLCWLLHYKSFNHFTSDTKITHSACNPPELPLLPSPQLDEYPSVAILLAVRNEEQNLSNCLDHLLAQDYPATRYSIWIGNDGSTDATLSIAQAYAARHAHIHIINVEENMGAARAKANVVAHLVRASQQQSTAASCLLITDADTRPPCYWMRGMIQAWQAASPNQQTGIITGTTLVAGKTAWAQLQCIDWLFSLGMVKVASDMGLPTATLGNNHLMSRQAYDATGGYESMPFSITEDFQILHAITRQGFNFKNVIHPYVINFTLPMPDLPSLIAQRKRWMRGALQLPWYIVGILILQACFYPVTIGLALYEPATAYLLFAGKILAQSLFIVLVAKKLRLQWPGSMRLYFFLLSYDLYIGFIHLLTLIYYLLPTKIRWKGRTF